MADGESEGIDVAPAPGSGFGLVKRWSRLSEAAQDRLVGAVLALPSGAVLGIARWLSPSAEGVGTHKQLGLSGCTVLTATGWPCPMCGMTTTFSHLAHLEVGAAALTQPFGVVLFSATLAAFALGTSDLIRPRRRWVRALRTLEPFEVHLAIGLLAGMALGWGYKVIAMGIVTPFGA